MVTLELKWGSATRRMIAKAESVPVHSQLAVGNDKERVREFAVYLPTRVLCDVRYRGCVPCYAVPGTVVVYRAMRSPRYCCGIACYAMLVTKLVYLVLLGGGRVVEP
eukprot:508909-Rhodomonas_salina.1